MHTGSEKAFLYSLDGADIIAQAQTGTEDGRVLGVTITFHLENLKSDREHPAFLLG